MTAPRRGLRFEHARWRQSVPGVRFEDCPPVVCRVTAIRRGVVYYRPVSEHGTGNPWYTGVEEFAEKVGRVLPDEPDEHRATPARLTTVGGSGAWRGALRAGSRTLVDCGHSHRNRDSGNSAARHCGQELVRAARHAETAARYVAASVYAAQRSRALGARITDEEARDRAAARVALWRDAVLVNDFHLPPPPGVFVNVPPCGCCPTTREDTTT